MPDTYQPFPTLTIGQGPIKKQKVARPLGEMPARGEGMDAVDVNAGRQLRKIRIERGYSQEFTGRAVGITFQQLQKYESGRNRISLSRLYHLARFLDVPVTYFFEGLAEQGGAVRLDEDDSFKTKRLGLELMRAFHHIPRNLQERLLEFAQSLALAFPAEAGADQ